MVTPKTKKNKTNYSMNHRMEMYNFYWIRRRITYQWASIMKHDTQYALYRTVVEFNVIYLRWNFKVIIQQQRLPYKFTIFFFLNY